MTTKIEWTDTTWNPIAGCTKISPGCKNCYAVRFAWRHAHNETLPLDTHALYVGVVDRNGNGQLDWTGQINLGSRRILDQPLHWKKPKSIFVCSMSDLFHLDTWPIRETIWEVMAMTPQHTYQILSKRANVMRTQVRELVKRFGILPNVWGGVTVENQQMANERMVHLMNTPLAKRFVSCEPLLSPIQFDDGVLSKIDLIIAGGETGPGARPMKPDWVHSLRDQAVNAGVSFFFKRWGDGKRDIDGKMWEQLPG